MDNLIEKYEEVYEKTDQYLSLLFDTFESENRTKLVDCFTTFNGGTFKSKEYVDCSELKLITIKNIDDNGFNTNKTSFLNPEIVDKKYLLKIGDILLTMTGNVGRLGIVDEPNCFLNQRVLKLDCLSKLYLYLYLKKYKNKIIQLGKGTAQQNLSLQDLNLLDVLNSFEEIKEFKNYDFYFEYLLNIKLKIKKLKEEKELLLKKYFG